MAYKYFSDAEISCNCGCGQKIENESLIEHLTLARVNANIPFVISSWNRCNTHNHNVGGSATSSHLTGKAVDITYKNNVDAFKIVNSLMAVGFKRIGINFKKKFVHVDVSADKISPILFSY